MNEPIRVGDPLESINDKMDVILASMDDKTVPAATAKPVQVAQLVRQASAGGSRFASANAFHTDDPNAPHAVVAGMLHHDGEKHQASTVGPSCCCFIPPIFLIFYFKYGKDWGDVDDDDVNCEDGYPAWMLVYALMGILLPCINFCVLTFVVVPYLHAAQNRMARGDAQGAKRKQKQATCVVQMVGLGVVACLGWFIYGVVLMFKK
eukprot:FR736897.1.p1 GENE.FR736897.1~~FR736897.1.p1  ORF type:complete len:220 (+),score=22.77 FR736897.1:43-660(+)